MAHFFLWFRAKFWVEPWRLWTSEKGDTARTTRRVMRGAVAVAAMALWLAVGVHPATAQAWRPMVFRADVPGIDENPLRGLVPYAMPRADASGFPHSMEWFSLPLSDVVAGPDVYNWAALERQLMMVAGHGNQAVVRFYVDNPKLPSGIPRYLLRAGVKTYPYEDEDNAKSATPSVAPDYGDPRLMECMVHFIRALGMKYDGDVRIAYLAAGLYGFWGEWHVLKHPLPGEPAGWAMAQKDKDALLRAYAESFHRTPVMVRTPAVTPARRIAFALRIPRRCVSAGHDWRWCPAILAGNATSWIDGELAKTPHGRRDFSAAAGRPVDRMAQRSRARLDDHDHHSTRNLHVRLCPVSAATFGSGEGQCFAGPKDAGIHPVLQVGAHVVGQEWVSDIECPDRKSGCGPDL